MKSGALYSGLYQWLLMPAWERAVRRRPTLDHLSFLETTQWMHPRAIEDLQLEKLRALLTYAGTNVPYYRELFAKAAFDPRGVTSRKDLAELPVLTREIVRERYADLVDPRHAATGQNLKKGTSGSTGTPLKFEYSRESEAWRQATRIRGYRWGGYEPGLPTFYYWAQVNELPSGAKGLKIKIDRALKREVFWDSMKQDEASNLEAVELIKAHRPRAIVAYTQSAAQFARFIVDRNLRDWDDIPVLCGAEAVLPADRVALAKAFGPEIFETYGSRETMLMAAECSAHDGMHLSEENLLVEVTKDGRPLPSGTAGDVVVTDLHNYGMPLIRYVNGDVATMRDGTSQTLPGSGPHDTDEPCSCGRGLRKLARVEGRRADTLTAKDGTVIPGIVFHVLFSDSRKEVVSQFQAIQHATGEVVLKVVRGQDWSAEAFEGLSARFRSYLRGLPFSVEFCDAIPAGANGKRKTIIVLRA